MPCAHPARRARTAQAEIPSRRPDGAGLCCVVIDRSPTKSNQGSREDLCRKPKLPSVTEPYTRRWNRLICSITHDPVTRKAHRKGSGGRFRHSCSEIPSVDREPKISIIRVNGRKRSRSRLVSRAQRLAQLGLQAARTSSALLRFSNVFPLHSAGSILDSAAPNRCGNSPAGGKCMPAFCMTSTSLGTFGGSRSRRPATMQRSHKAKGRSAGINSTAARHHTGIIAPMQ